MASIIDSLQELQMEFEMNNGEFSVCNKLDAPTCAFIEQLFSFSCLYFIFSVFCIREARWTASSSRISCIRSDSAMGSESKVLMKLLRGLFPRAVVEGVVFPLLLPLLVLALVGCKARVRVCSSAQSRPSTPPLWSKVRILLTTLLTLTPVAFGACDVTKCTPTPCSLTDGHLIVPNNVTSIADCKLVVV
jgi:hypothetical protein